MKRSSRFQSQFRLLTSREPSVSLRTSVGDRRTQSNVPHFYLFPPGDVRCVVVTTSLSSKERFEVLPSTYFDKGVSPLRDGGGSALGSRLSLLYPKQKSSCSSAKPLKRPSWSSHLAGAHERHAFGPQLWSSCQAGTRKAEGSAALPSGVQQRCPRAPTPEPGKGRRPKNRHSSKAKRVSARVFCLLPVLACLWRGFPGSGSLVLRPCLFGFLFVLFRLMFLFLGRGRHVPAPSGRTSGQAQGHRPKNWNWAPTQGPAFSGTLYVRVSRLFRRACLVLSLPLCYFIYFAYVPLVRDAFRLPSTAHYWPQIILRLDCGSFICTRPSLS